MPRNLLSRVKFVKVSDVAASATTDVNSAIVDTAGYEGVVFLTSLSTANATNTIKVQQNTANQTTGMADLEGTEVSSGTTDEDLIVEVHKPGERYVQAVVTRGAASTVENIWAALYGKGGQHAASTLAGTAIAEVHNAPAEGTA